MELLVGIPKAGFGNANDGRFFLDPQTSSGIIEVNIKLTKKSNMIPETLSSGHKIDEIENFAEQTAKLYVKLYGWHPMTPVMNKILIHGAKIIDQANLSIGQLSEEAAEVRSKEQNSVKF